MNVEIMPMVQRITARKKGTTDKFLGIQGVYLNDPSKLALGGNLIYHIMYWNKTEEELVKIKPKWEKDFPQYEFKMKLQK